MAAIPWWTWLGLGLFVTIFSISVGGQLKLFAWVGLIFIAVGIAKLIYRVILHPKEEQKAKQVQHRQHYVRRQPVCRRCMAGVTQADRFCKYCGLRLRQ